MFSATVRSSYNPNFCDMYPIRSLMRSGDSVTSMPATVAVPADGASNPHNIRIVVVFPEPFGPRSPNTSPVAIWRLRSRTAVIGPKRRVRPRVSTANGVTAGG